MSRVLVAAPLAAGDRCAPGNISLSLAISAMCSDVKTIFPLPQHACGKRPAAAPSRSHPSVQRIRAAASAGSKNSRSMSMLRRWFTSLFIAVVTRGNMTMCEGSGLSLQREGLCDIQCSRSGRWTADREALNPGTLTLHRCLVISCRQKVSRRPRAGELVRQKRGMRMLERASADSRR